MSRAKFEKRHQKMDVLKLELRDGFNANFNVIDKVSTEIVVIDGLGL